MELSIGSFTFKFWMLHLLDCLKEKLQVLRHMNVRHSELWILNIKNGANGCKDPKVKV